MSADQCAHPAWSQVLQNGRLKLWFFPSCGRYHYFCIFKRNIAVLWCRSSPQSCTRKFLSKRAHCSACITHTRAYITKPARSQSACHTAGLSGPLCRSCLWCIVQEKGPGRGRPQSPIGIKPPPPLQGPRNHPLHKLRHSFQARSVSAFLLPHVVSLLHKVCTFILKGLIGVCGTGFGCC